MTYNYKLFIDDYTKANKEIKQYIDTKLTISDIKSTNVKVDGRTELGIVYNLVTGQSYISGQNQYNIFNKTSKIAIFERAYKYPNICKKLYDNGIKWRSPGAIALSLANANNYKFILFGGKSREFDLAAGLKLCEGLNTYKNDEFLLVCENDEVFIKIKEIIKEK